jgi:hypothetical protein
MNSGIFDDSEQIDHRTSRSICDAIGQRLQQDLPPEPTRLSTGLQRLLDELRASETARTAERPEPKRDPMP